MWKLYPESFNGWSFNAFEMSWSNVIRFDYSIHTYNFCRRDHDNCFLKLNMLSPIDMDSVKKRLQYNRASWMILCDWHRYLFDTNIYFNILWYIPAWLVFELKFEIKTRDIDKLICVDIFFLKYFWRAEILSKHLISTSFCVTIKIIGSIRCTSKFELNLISKFTDCSMKPHWWWMINSHENNLRSVLLSHAHHFYVKNCLLWRKIEWFPEYRFQCWTIDYLISFRWFTNLMANSFWSSETTLP